MKQQGRGSLAVFPGSFDPITNGHLDIIARGLSVFDDVTIAILINPGKQTLFTVEERVEIIREAYRGEPRVKVDTFSGLLVDYAERVGAAVIVRGLRAISDFEYEFQMALMNRRLNPRIETVFMMPAEGYSYLSSRLVKEVFQLGGRVRDLVPPIVERRLAEKYGAEAPSAVPPASPQGAVKGNGSAVDLSRRALDLKISSTVAVAQRAAALKAAGQSVLDFSVGEPDQPTPAHIKEAAVAALSLDRTRYTPAAGIPELRAAIAMRYRQDFDVTFAPEEVAVTMGGKQALHLVCNALLDRGDEVVIPTPHWPTFSEAVRLAGGRPVVAQTREQDGFRVSARLVARAVTSRTKAVLVNSPGNPTGAVIEDAELLAIARMAKRRKFTILYDDTYARMTFGGAEPPDLQEAREVARDRFVVLGTASKSYCMTGWRIGWIMGPRRLIDASAALVSHSTQCPTSFAQAGAVEALIGPQRFVGDQTAEYERRRDTLHTALTGIDGLTCVLPDGAFYLFPNVTKYLSRRMPDDVRLATAILEEARVAVVPGEAFGGPGHIRISFARPLDELQDGARRITAFLARVRGD